MSNIFSHNRLISIILLVIFVMFMAFSFATVPVKGEVITAILGTGIVLVAGALLTSIGITFPTARDLQVSVSSFLQSDPKLQYMCERISQTPEYVANSTVALGAMAGASIGDLFSSWTEGWSYFIESAQSFFGTNGAVKPAEAVSIDDYYFDSSGSVFSLPTVYASDSVYIGGSKRNYMPKNYAAITGVTATLYGGTGFYTMNFPDNCSVNKITTGNNSYFEFFGNFITSDSGATTLSIYYRNNTFSPGLWKNYMGKTSSSSFTNQYSLFVNRINTSNPSIMFSLSDHEDTMGLANERSDIDVFPLGGIVPAWDIPNDGIPIADVKGKGETVLDGGGTIALDIGTIKGIIGELLPTIGTLLPDISIDWTQDAIIADTALDTDKPMPTPSPVPSPSPSTKPSPLPSTKPDIPIAPLPPLSKKFPFCLPFDFIALISALNAEPAAPHFEIPVQYAAIGLDEKIVVDLSQFEPYIVYFRIFVILDFVILLIFISRKMIGS